MKKSEKYFYLSNGDVFKTIEDFAAKLDEISDEVFNSHVNEDRNDFANWIEGVFKNKEIAKLVRENKNRKVMQFKLLKYIVKQNLKPKRKHICKICGRKFDKKVALSVHMAVAHKKKKVK